MELHNLTPAAGSNKKGKRVGRGYGSGKGRTSTRGHKDAKARSGYKKKIGFEGGQMPLQRRVPKFGFQNINRVEYRAVNVEVLEKIATDKGLTKITVADIVNAGYAHKGELVKVLAKGELNAKIDVEANAFSKKAEEAITSKGGNVVKL